jgi:co-chaperonin GroES (HSP10)
MVAVAEKVNLKIRPLGDRALVERLEADQKTPAGLSSQEPRKKSPKKALFAR